MTHDAGQDSSICAFRFLHVVMPFTLDLKFGVEYEAKQENRKHSKGKEAENWLQKLFLQAKQFSQSVKCLTKEECSSRK